MIARAPLKLCSGRPLGQADQDQFLQMLPSIRAVAHFAVRGRLSDHRQEFVAEVIANAFVAFCRLVERGKAAVAYPTVLATYAVKQVCDGRRIGGQLNIHDASSQHCQQRKGIRWQSLRRFDPAQGQWREIVCADGRASPADVAAIRLDFAEWLRRLPSAKRNVAQLLATGEGTQAAAKQFGVSKARVSQIRAELRTDWAEFQGEPAVAAA